MPAMCSSRLMLRVALCSAYCRWLHRPLENPEQTLSSLPHSTRSLQAEVPHMWPQIHMDQDQASSRKQGAEVAW